ncbi:MAG: regulatory protein RecX [Jatrophihabitans sp.]
MPAWPTAAPPPPDDQDAQPPGDPEAAARTICLRLLDHRARSRSELAQALRKRGVPEQAATRVLDRFAEVGLINDAALAEAVAGAQHRERGLARRAVAAKLRQRGFDDEIVGSAVSGIEPAQERERALALVERRQRALAGFPVEVQTRRLVGLLARKGYPSGVAYAVVREVLAGGGHDIEDVGHGRLG